MDERKIFEELTIVPLLTKYIRGEELTVLEKKTIDVWIAESKSNEIVFEQLQDDEQLAAAFVDFKIAESTTEEGLQKIHGLLNRRKSRQKWSMYMRTAAAVLLMISISVWLYRYYQSDKILPSEQTATHISDDVLPGTDQATLTFDDGKVIELVGDKKAIKIDDRGISYIDGTSISVDKVKFATLSTPRKGQYQVTLPDGTKVWLNAESSLKYPTQFSSSERFVELQGEGYFEVVHDRAKPFIVASNGQQVKVLGTTFNINSYDNEPGTRTTLLSGSVELSTISNKKTIKLKPGQQGRLVNDGFDVKTVDTKPFTAWTSNEFQFQGTTLQEVLRQLERWYDIEVDYSQIPNDIQIQATISRDKKLSTVLYSLEKISNLKFQLNKGSRLQITK